ncbi:MAG: alcohol dehydrogenase catalytic domain-containing protein [Reyranella sp.]|uniref:alcohol dehydrogenase catalytic domain-containing protein n=1 Tax=Reyranella sp. TaxID=1929291 RepID=UPI001AD25545|nr:alcohol dehydrogenase catalytic domain-containing protein [Reyranella sp.]MBN9087197.1 alcohol dehydrogenase catalytic domain-containing protein [Reyranella sp.]
MKAAVLKALGAPLAVESVPDPVLGTGEVIVDVVATRMLAYAGEVFSGERQYLLELPIVPGPGGVGRVRAVGPDATRLAVGDWVSIDPTVRSRDDTVSPDIILQGLTAGSQAALRLQRHYHDGAFAQQVRVPTENISLIGAIDAADAGRWCALGTLLIPYGGLLAGRLAAGETVLVNGATGAFGSAGVAVGVAMGASVVATGRNEAALADLERRFGNRVRTVKMTGNEEDDRRQMQRAADGPVDCVLDLLPPMAESSWVRAAVLAVRPCGRAILMGGIRDDVALPYAWMMRECIEIRGQWMYPRDATQRMIGLIRSGLIRLEDFAVTEFPLDKVNEAVAHAAGNTGPFKMTVVRP